LLQNKNFIDGGKAQYCGDQIVEVIVDGWRREAMPFDFLFLSTGLPLSFLPV